ncbi:MAG: toprim domain-containing protein [Methanotrichaceae archaeon]
MRKNRNLGMKKVSCDIESLEGLIDDLQEASDRGAAIIVEGIKDQRSLRELGIAGPIITTAQRPALDVAEGTAREFKYIIVLTDWDRTGEERAHEMERYLLCTEAHADLDIRKKLKNLVRREIKDVESLSKFVERARAAEAYRC